VDIKGNIKTEGKLNVTGKVAVGVNNPQEDVYLTVGGPIRFQDKKMEYADKIPLSGNYTKGDIVWNIDPKPGQNIGWVCIRQGSPGEWKPFGRIDI